LIAVVIEAQACGTCVIGSSNGEIPKGIWFEELLKKEESLRKGWLRRLSRS